MSKRKSCRPWISSVGVVIDRSFASGERVDASAVTGAMFVLVRSEACAASSSGSQRLCGTSAARYLDEPRLREALRRERGHEVRPRDHRDDRLERDAGRQCVPDGAAAERDAERADLRVGDLGRALSNVKSSRVSCTSRGPSSPKRPSEAPWPRASHSSVAYPAGARNCVASGSRSWCLPPRPWKSMSRAAAGGSAAPSGSTSEQASFAPSDAGKVSCCGVAASADPLHDERGGRLQRRSERRPTTGDRVALLYNRRRWMRGPSACSTPASADSRPPRVPRDDAARGLRLSRRPRAAAVWAPAARRGPRFAREIGSLSRDAGREAHRRRVQHRDVRRAAALQEELRSR